MVTKQFEPFVFLDVDGNLSEFRIEPRDAVATDLNLDYEWATVTEQLDAVERGEADVAIAGSGMTPECKPRAR